MFQISGINARNLLLFLGFIAIILLSFNHFILYPGAFFEYLSADEFGMGGMNKVAWCD